MISLRLILSSGMLDRGIVENEALKRQSAALKDHSDSRQVLK